MSWLHCERNSEMHKQSFGKFNGSSSIPKQSSRAFNFITKKVGAYEEATFLHPQKKLVDSF